MTRIIVVGAGTAGMPLAIAAADGGADVVLLEKSGRVGGTLFWSRGQLAAAGTAAQQAAGISDSPTAHFDDAFRLGHGQADPALLRRATELAPAMIAWLQEHGMQFPAATPHQSSHEPYRVPRSHTGVREGRSILEVFEPELRRRLEAGSIDLLFRHRAQRLLMERDAVIGVEAVAADGEPKEILGDAVVLATGGYGANPRYVAAAGPVAESALIASAETSTGDGLRMAAAIGGEWVRRDVLLAAEGGIEDPDRPGFTLPYVYPALNPAARPPAEIWINARGERFVAEDEPSQAVRERALLAQPGGAMWIVFDETILQHVAPLLSSTSPEVPRFTPVRVRELATRNEIFAMSNSLAGLAAAIGVPAGALQATVAGYNGMVAYGSHDPLGRQIRPFSLDTPPFYALPVRAKILNVAGGLKVDDSLRVLSEDGPIAGLYAVGEVCGSGLLSGDAFVGGLSLTGALTLGRWLGETLSGAR